MLDDCGSIDMVIGKPRCFLNRRGCGVGVVDPDSAGVEPPADWDITRFARPFDTEDGASFGARFPDGHVGRRLDLWEGNGYAHAFKDADLMISFTTQTSAFCRYHNINLTELGAFKCSTTLTAAQAIQYGLDFTNDMDADEAVCLPREGCEALCRGLPDCTGFDMHKTLPFCYLNTGACTDLVSEGAKEFDLAMKEVQPACTLTLSGASLGADIYTQTTDRTFEANTLDGYSVRATPFSRENAEPGPC
jgi:hypothetical protein